MQKNEVTKDLNIKPISMYDEMSSSYLSYAMSVIISRALPDIRDGLKPVHRRILYAMHKGGFDWSKQFRKSARIVGDVIGKYHPHGDQAVYDALVRMVQDFSMSVPLIDGQGNFGSIDGDPPAAMRYTETKLAKISQFLIDDIEKNTVSFKSNYDETEQEPTVLPAQYPNLLVNGAGGIAVGMATSIPPHNLGEIIDGTLALIKNKDIKVKELMKHIPGPDFPTGGVIIGKDIIREGYKTGRGSFKIRGEINVENLKNGKDRLVITSIPYQVNKSNLNEKIAELVRDKKIEGISDIRDESNREGIRVAIDLRRSVEPETIKRQLYKYTSIETSFGFNSLAIVDNKPKTCSLKDFLENFLKFREDVVIKKTKYDLKKAEDRVHVLLGLSVSVENIDKVIKIIRSSKNPEEAKNTLIKTKWKITKSAKLIKLVDSKNYKGSYNLSETQVTSILELRLQKLTALGINEIEEEIKKLSELITKYKKIINSKDQKSEIKAKEKFILSITENGYGKRTSHYDYRVTNRGGKGIIGIVNSQRNGNVSSSFPVFEGDQILISTNKGRVIRTAVKEIRIAGRNTQGVRIIKLTGDEKVVSAIKLDDNLI